MRILANLRPWFVFSVCLIPSLYAAGLSFEQNLGQTAAEIRYLARTSSGVIFITDRGFTLNGGAAYELLDGNPSAHWMSAGATGERISYFIGRDPSKWVHDAPRYERLVRHNAYPGIDLILYGDGKELEYDFVLAPHTDPARIRLKMPGARSVSITADGALVVDTPAGELRHRKPILFETLPDGSRRSIAGSFRMLERDEVGFSVNGHDPALALSIDPVLESSTYFGGSGNDQVVATDGKGILVGTTTSIDLPGAQFARRHGTDLFVKLAQLIMVFGGSGNETVTSAAFGTPTSDFFLAVAGYTDSTDLPNFSAVYGGPAPLQPNFAGGATDGFLVMVNKSNFLPALTYIGGPGDDRINAISFDPYTAMLAIAGETTAGGLPAPPFVLSQIQESPAGGLDGFVMISSSNPFQAQHLYYTSYLGGSGDDTILGAAFLNGVCYVTGETKSQDFPLKNALYSKRAGDSDAFVAKIANDGTLAASTLFGGSGSDHGAALGVLPAGNVFVAGVTSSKDLPSHNPTQKSYGGGPSDAFLAEFDADLSTLVSSTYIGGSEADEATSIAVAVPNTVFVGGWTASQNFPVVNALQSKYGGGPDDGFLVHFDDNGSIYQATFFGGSGSDRILGLGGGLYSGPTVWLTGETASPNLPLENANQTGLRGSSDGFVAEITANLFTVAPFRGGKDLRSPLEIYYGNQALANAIPFTVTSSDPSKVQVAVGFNPGVASVTFYPNQPYVDCLTDSGRAELTITASGYPSRTVQASCFPQAIVVATPNAGTSDLQTSIGAFPSAIGFTQVVNDPKIGPLNTGAFTRPGANPVTVEIANSNSFIGKLSATSVNLSYSGQNLTFTPLAIGHTDLTFNARDIAFLPSNKLHASVGGSIIPPQPFSVPSGFQATLWLSQSLPPETILSITSKDPSRVALSLDQTKPGKASITLLNSNLSGQPFFVQALGSSGDVQLIFTVTGQPAVATTVHITTPVAVFSYGNYNIAGGQQLQIQPGATASVAFSIYPADLSHVWSFSLNPGKPPISFSLQSSSAGVVKITPGSTKITSLSGGGNFQVIGATPGSTVLTLTNSANIPAGGPFPSVRAVVQKPAVLFPDIELGKDLTAPMSIRLPAPATSGIVTTVTVSDPTKALLSLDATSPGQSQISIIIPLGQTYAQFYVQALASSGTAKVTAAFTGYLVSTATANVKLDPAGFYWSADAASATLGQQASVALQSGTLDAATLLPLDSQSLRPGATVAPGFTNSNPNVATIDPKTALITPKSPGNTILTLRQPAGFSVPSVRQKLALTVADRTLILYSFNLGKNTQVALNVYQLALKVTSSDPAKVLVSTDPGKLGSASVTATATQQVYVQALAGSGSVNLTVSSPGFSDTTLTVGLVPTGLGISLDSYSGNFQNGKYTTTTQSKVTVNVFLYAGNGPVLYGATFVPGLPPLSANITSSNPGVGVVTGSPIVFDPKHMTYGQALATATLLPVNAGETIIAISQPPGFAPAGSDQLTVDVVLPALAMSDFLVAKDTLNSVTINLPQGAKTGSAGTALTLTSSDPSRILLSSDASTPPAASITTAFQPGSQGAGFYVHALSDTGMASIRMTSPGFADGTFTVRLAPLAFEFTNVGTAPTHALIQRGPVQSSVAAAVLTTAYTPYVPLMLRPGVADILVGVSSSDPSIVSVSPKQLVFKGNVLQGSVTYKPLRPGTATLRLTAPSGYGFSPSFSQLFIQVDEDTISIPYSTSQIGRDLQAPINFSVQAPNPNLSVKVTSSDPSRLVVSPDAVTPGHGSVVLPPGTSSAYAQALAGSGDVMLFFTAPGYQTGTFPVTLTPAGAVFSGCAQSNILANAGVQQVSVTLTSLDPVTLQPGTSPQFPRPGASFSVPVSSSDTNVMAVTTPTVQISAQQINGTPATAGFQPVAAGTAIVSLGALAGNPASASGNQIVFTVSEAQLSIPAFALGIDLQTAVQITLGSSVATPKVDTPIAVSVSNYYIALAANLRDAGQNTLSVIIPAGQRVSKPFYVQGRAIGSDSLSYGGGSFQSYSTIVTVTQTAFVIQEAAGGQGLNLNKGASAKITIVPALSPLSNIVTGPFSIRGGASPITIAIASTQPSVATTSPSQLTFNPGDQKATVSVQGLAAGTATVKVLGTIYDFRQPQSAIQVTVK